MNEIEYLDRCIDDLVGVILTYERSSKKCRCFNNKIYKDYLSELEILKRIRIKVIFYNKMREVN